jgi:hypothetical protein
MTQRITLMGCQIDNRSVDRILGVGGTFDVTIGRARRARGGHFIWWLIKEAARR